MKEVVEGIGMLFALIAMRLGAAGWYLLKAAVLVAIIIGAGSELIDQAPAGWPPLELSLGVLGEYIKLAFLTASNGWQIISVALLFYAVWALVVPFVMKIETHSYQTKVAVVSIANYLEIEVETNLTKALDSEGMRGLLRRGKEKLFLLWFFGHVDDDSLSARAVRSGREVSLLEDLKREANLDSKLD